MTDVLYYRFSDPEFEEDGIPINGGALYQVDYRMVRKTPKGAWIVPVQEWRSQKPRFVLDGPGKRYAYPNFVSALRSYAARKRRQLAILEWQKKVAEAGLKDALRRVQAITGKPQL